MDLGRLRPLAVLALLAEHKEIVDVIRQPLGVEGKVLGGHGRFGKLVLVGFVRVPAIKDIAKAGRVIVQPVKFSAIAIGHSAYLTIAIQYECEGYAAVIVILPARSVRADVDGRIVGVVVADFVRHKGLIRHKVVVGGAMMNHALGRRFGISSVHVLQIEIEGVRNVGPELKHCHRYQCALRHGGAVIPIGLGIRENVTLVFQQIICPALKSIASGGGRFQIERLTESPLLPTDVTADAAQLVDGITAPQAIPMDLDLELHRVDGKAQVGAFVGEGHHAVDLRLVAGLPVGKIQFYMLLTVIAAVNAGVIGTKAGIVKADVKLVPIIRLGAGFARYEVKAGQHLHCLGQKDIKVAVFQINRRCVILAVRIFHLKCRDGAGAARRPQRRFIGVYLRCPRNLALKRGKVGADVHEHADFHIQRARGVGGFGFPRLIVERIQHIPVAF